MAFNSAGGFSGAASGAALGASLAAPTGGLSVPLGALIGAAGGFGLGGLLGGEGQAGPNIDINAELARINALYEQARTQGTAAITQDFQAQRGELAQSQAARGIYRSGVSQLGLARLGAARQQALGAFNAQLSASQAGQQSSLLNALLGRKSALDENAFNRRQQSQNQILGLGAGILGSALQGGAFSGGKPSTGGYNFAGSNMVAPQAATPQAFYQSEFGGSGFGTPMSAGGGSGMRSPFF